MPLNSAELELNPGQSPTDNLSALSQKLFMRNITNQRLALAQEGKREQGGNFLKDYLNPAHYLTGSDYDPVITSKLHLVLAKGAGLAQQGADIPSLLMAMGPAVGEINQYVSKAKLIDQRLKDSMGKIKQYNGYNQEALMDAARRAAFHDIDPKTGAYGGLKDINSVDPDTDYIQQALKENPGELTTNKGFDEYAAKIPKDVNLLNSQLYDEKTGLLNSQKLKTTGQNYMIPDKDERGNTVLVPQYDHANDGGKLLEHDFTDSTGKKTTAPVRLLDEKLFDDIMRQRPDAADNMRGQVLQHLNEFNAGKDEQVTLDSPKAKLIARALAYDEMKRASLSSVENAEVVNKPSAQALSISLHGNDYERSYNRTAGRDDANLSRGILPGSKGDRNSINTIDALHEISTNNPQFLHGERSEQQGQAVINVTNMLPKAQLKFGGKANESYKNVFYNPVTHSYLLQKRDADGTFDPEVKEKDMQNFLYKVATPNGVPNGVKYVDKSLQKYGYANGAYADKGEAPDLTDDVAKTRDTKVTHAMDELDARGSVKNLKGITTPDGDVTSVYVRGGFKTGLLGMGKYILSVKGPDGKIKETDFKDRPALEKYLKQSTLKAPAPNADALLDKYSK